MDVEHEILVKHQVVVMDCKSSNVQATSSRPKWEPTATSTPIRGPLITLSNFEYVYKSKSTESKATPRINLTKRIEDINKESAKKSDALTKKKVNRRKNQYLCTSSEDEDDDDDKCEGEKKGLVIKIGSSERKLKRNLSRINSTTQNEEEKNENDEKCEESYNKSLEKSMKNDNSKTKLRKKTALTKVKVKNMTEESNKETDSGVASKRKTTSVKSPTGMENKDQTPVSVKCNGNVSLKGRNGFGKLSVSHEIFSDNKEREHRNSLNMSVLDGEKFDENNLEIDDTLYNVKNRKRSLLKAKMAHQNCKEKSVNNEVGNDEVKECKRNRKSPREYWLPRVEEPEKIHEPVITKDTADEKVQVTSSTTEQNETCVVGCNNDPVSNNIENENSPENIEYIKDVAEMEFDESGVNEKEKFFVGLGWELPKFKCCVLKMKKKGEVSGRTNYENSHFGGIIVKGKLTMTIQGNEYKMKSTQMFHVPPLTDWKVVNTGTTECIIYYWCGRM